jgi:hypothetical protein
MMAAAICARHTGAAAMRTALKTSHAPGLAAFCFCTHAPTGGNCLPVEAAAVVVAGLLPRKSRLEDPGRSAQSRHHLRCP